MNTSRAYLALSLWLYLLIAPVHRRAKYSIIYLFVLRVNSLCIWIGLVCTEHYLVYFNRTGCGRNYYVARYRHRADWLQRDNKYAELSGNDTCGAHRFIIAAKTTSSIHRIITQWRLAERVACARSSRSLPQTLFGRLSRRLSLILFIYLSCTVHTNMLNDLTLTLDKVKKTWRRREEKKK